MKRLLFSSGQPDRSVPAGYVEIIYSPENGGLAIKRPDGSLDPVGVSIEGTPVLAIPASIEINAGGDDNNLIFTAKTAGESGNSIGIKYTLPPTPDESISVSVDGSVIDVSLATSSGQKARKTTLSGILVEADVAGTSGNGLSFELKMKDSPLSDPIGDARIILGSQPISTAPGVVYLATDAGVESVASLTETSPLETGDIIIGQKIDAIGSWSNGVISFEVNIGYASEQFSITKEEADGIVRFLITLPADINGDVIPVLDSDLVMAIEDAISDAGLSDYLHVYLESTGGSFITPIPETFMYGGVDPAPDDAVNLNEAICDAIDSLAEGFSVPAYDPSAVTLEEVVTLTTGGTNFVSLTTAAQVKSAIEANSEANALVTITSSAPITGTINGGFPGVAYLDGGSDATVATKGTEMFDSTNKYTAISDVIASSTSGWRKVAHSAL